MVLKKWDVLCLIGVLIVASSSAFPSNQKALDLIHRGPDPLPGAELAPNAIRYVEEEVDSIEVTRIEAEAAYPAGTSVIVTLSGTLKNSCLEILRPIQVERQGDVFLILPDAVRNRELCRPQVRQFKYQIDLGVLEAGEYLLHARTYANGGASRVISVIQDKTRIVR